MNDSQKAEIVVKDYAGNIISPFNYTATFAPVAVAHVQTGAPQWLIADAAGAGTLTIIHNDGRSGVLEVVVTAAPLAVTLKDPVAK